VVGLVNQAQGSKPNIGTPSGVACIWFATLSCKLLFKNS